MRYQQLENDALNQRHVIRMLRNCVYFAPLTKNVLDRRTWLGPG